MAGQSAVHITCITICELGYGASSFGCLVDIPGTGEAMEWE